MNPWPIKAETKQIYFKTDSLNIVARTFLILEFESVLLQNIGILSVTGNTHHSFHYCEQYGMGYFTSARLR